MIEPRCPECISPEIEPDLDSTTMQWRCGNCGERFDFEAAFVQLREVEDFRSEMESEPLFHFHRNRAQIELRASDGGLRALNPYSDAEELHRILDAAAARRVIEAGRPGAALHAYLLPGAEPHPVLGVDAGIGPELIGSELTLHQKVGEDPISFTVRWLGQIVNSANDLLIGRMHGVLGGRPAAGPGSVGPRSHRPTPSASPQRRYIAAGYWLRPDATTVPKVEAEGFSIAVVLAEFGERIEAGDRDPDAVALEVTVSWRDEEGERGEEIGS